MKTIIEPFRIKLVEPQSHIDYVGEAAEALYRRRDGRPAARGETPASGARVPVVRSSVVRAGMLPASPHP